jgi:hypothetical protein
LRVAPSAKIETAPALPSAFTAMRRIRSSAVFATYRKRCVRSNATPFAPKGGFPWGRSSGSAFQSDFPPPVGLTV